MFADEYRTDQPSSMFLLFLSYAVLLCNVGRKYLYSNPVYDAADMPKYLLFYCQVMLVIKRLYFTL